jgi:hypothetical protein
MLKNPNYNFFYEEPVFYYDDDQPNKIRWGEERKLYIVLWESPKERDHSEDRGVDGRMDLREIGWGSVDWV